MLFNMNILHLSDTHGAHRSLGRLPEADVIVHSGDITMNGSSSEVLDFMRWFSALPYAHKVFSLPGTTMLACTGPSLTDLTPIAIICATVQWR